MTILLVEDDDVDAMAIERAFRKTNIPVSIARARNGEEALRYIREESCDQKLLVLLDLNMPRMSGIEFLSEIRQDMKLRKTIVVVLTTSNNRDDVERCFDYNVAGYFTKVAFNEQASEFVQCIYGYLNKNQFPLHPGRGVVA